MDLIFQLALQYGKGKLTEAGIAYAMKQLGIGPASQNEIDVLTGGGITSTFNPANFLKRAAVNVIGQNLTKNIGLGSMSSMALPILGGALALGIARNPLRPGSANYNPELQGQINYLSGLDGYIGKDPGTGLRKYGPNSVLAGQNVVSMFGTNDYGKQLQKKLDYFNKQEKKKGFLTEGQKKKKQATRRELENLTTDEFDQVDTFISSQSGSGNGGGFNQAAYDAGKASAVAQEQSNRDYARGKFGQGGIASL